MPPLRVPIIALRIWKSQLCIGSYYFTSCGSTSSMAVIHLIILRGNILNTFSFRARFRKKGSVSFFGLANLMTVILS